MRGGGCSNVGLGGGVHADPTSQRRRQCSGEKRAGRAHAEAGDHDQAKQHDAENRQHRILAAHEHHGTGVNGVADLLHGVGAIVVALNQPEDDEGGHKANDTERGWQQRHISHSSSQLFWFLNVNSG